MTSHLPHPAFGGTTSGITYNPIVMPGKHELRANFYIEAGQVLEPGAVLGMVTATEELKLSVAAAADGSQVPFAILPEALDTTGGSKLFYVFVEGYFNETALVYGTGHDPDTVRKMLADKGIYLQVPRFSFV